MCEDHKLRSITVSHLLLKIKQERERRIARGEDISQFELELEAEESRGNTLTMRIIGPIVTFVNRPWKMYPVGVLFGFGQLTHCSIRPCYPISNLPLLGFDTASSIALLATSAIAKKDSDGKEIPSSYIVILPVRQKKQSHRCSG